MEYRRSRRGRYGRIRYFCNHGRRHRQNRQIHCADYDHLRILYAPCLLVQSGSFQRFCREGRRLQHEGHAAAPASHRLWRLDECHLGLRLHRLCACTYRLSQQPVAGPRGAQHDFQRRYSDAVFPDDPSRIALCDDLSECRDRLSGRCAAALHYVGDSTRRCGEFLQCGV